MSRWISTGCLSLDRALDGGLAPNGITLVYGEAEAGKTSLAMQCAVNTARMGLKALFVDSDGSFSLDRLSQIASKESEEVSSLIIVSRPLSFEEQAAIVDDLDRYVSKGFGLIVFDTITSLYRSELGSKEDAFRLNRELNRQVAALAQVCKTLGVALLANSQVRSIIELDQSEVEPVATRVLRFWSKSVLHLTRAGQRNVIRATVEKSEGKEKEVEVNLVIGNDGIRDLNQ